MVYNVTLTVGKGFGGQLPYLGNDFGGLTLIFGIPFAGGGGSGLHHGLWYTGSALNNPEKLGFLSRAEGVGALRIWEFLPESGGGGGFWLGGVGSKPMEGLVARRVWGGGSVRPSGKHVKRYLRNHIIIKKGVR